MRQRLRYMQKNGEGKQRQQCKEGERDVMCVYLKLPFYVNMVWANKQKVFVKLIKDMH